MRIVQLKIIFLVTLTGNAVAQPAATPTNCSIKTDQGAVAAIQAKYAKLGAALAAAGEERAKKINVEGVPGNNAGNAANIYAHVEQRRVDFSIDLPNVKMHDQKGSLDLPQVTMATKSWSYTTLQPEIGQECHPGPDEPVWHAQMCDTGWPLNQRFECGGWFETRPGKDLCLPTVTMRSIQQSVSMEVPQTIMVRQDWIISIPEFTMTTQKMSLDYPVIVVDDAQKKTAQQKKDADDLGNDMNSSARTIQADMKKEMYSVTSAPLISTFGCQRSALQVKIREAYDKLKSTTSVIAAGLVKAQEVRSPEMIAAYQKSLDDLNASMKKFLLDYEKARQEMRRAEQATIAKLGN